VKRKLRYKVMQSIYGWEGCSTYTHYATVKGPKRAWYKSIQADEEIDSFGDSAIFVSDDNDEAFDGYLLMDEDNKLYVQYSVDGYETEKRMRV
jgi:hypothetical protein